MPKTSDERIQSALAAIQENAGRTARDWVEAKLPADPVTLANWSSSISLGDRGLIKSDAETRKRNLIRGVLLAYSAADVSTLRMNMVKDALKNESVGQLTQRLTKFLPSTQIVGNFSARTTWDPGRFTNPANHHIGAFRYMITGVVKAPVKIAARGFLASEEEAAAFVTALKRYPPEVLSIEKKGSDKQQKEILNIKPALRYLTSPDLLRYDIISTSVIDNDHVSTYFPWGFILRVPPENIVSANSKDQAVANRPSNAILEMERVNREKGLSTPEEVLAATTGRNGDTGYNEVVVIGRSPEGKQVDVIGIFVKVAVNNSLYIRNRSGEDQPYIADILEEIKACSRTHNIPVVNIPDPTGKPSTVAWPF